MDRTERGELAANVARGAAWLDTEVPGWRDRIDTSTLDLADVSLCVLGQAFPPSPAGQPDWWREEVYGSWADRPGYTRTRYVYPDLDLDAHGFRSYSVADDEVLTELWRELLTTVPADDDRA